MTREELRKKAREANLKSVINRREYNGIRVFLHGTRIIEVKPIDSDIWYKYDTDDIEDQVAATRNGSSFMGIPKSIWEEWLAEPFLRD